jgi:hypothetical protein
MPTLQSKQQRASIGVGSFIDINALVKKLFYDLDRIEVASGL